MEYEITGSTLQALKIKLAAGESVYTETGGMSWMTDNIDMKTNIKGGLVAGLKRKISGESLFLTTYTCEGSEGMVTFANEFPGAIIPMDLAAGQNIICQRDSFMCAQEGVLLEHHFHKRLGAGFFGGEGFILQKITGPGTAFIEIDGDKVQKKLEPGEKIKVDAGHIAAFDPTVSYDIGMVKGVSNVLFGGEGLFLATLTGPGNIILQTMPIRNLANKLRQYIIPPGKEHK